MLQTEVFVTNRRVHCVVLELRGILLAEDELALVLCQVAWKDDLVANRGQEVIELWGRAFPKTRNCTCVPVSGLAIVRSELRGISYVGVGSEKSVRSRV